MGHFEQVISDVERALVLDPGLPGAKERLEDARKKLASGIHVVGDGVSSPALLFRPDPPKYTREARDAGLQGIVFLQFVVDEKGHPKDFKIVRSLGLGLDEKAIEACRKWRFKPSVKEGKAVSVVLSAEVKFHLSK